MICPCAAHRAQPPALAWPRPREVFQGRRQIEHSIGRSHGTFPWIGPSRVCGFSKCTWSPYKPYNNPSYLQDTLDLKPKKNMAAINLLIKSLIPKPEGSKYQISTYLPQNLYYDYYYSKPKYLIIGYLDPLGKWTLNPKPPRLASPCCTILGSARFGVQAIGSRALGFRFWVLGFCG